MLHIINNYTGDRMAFDMGREMAEAEGVKIGTVIVDDDVAVKDSTYTVGRRGVAGNFFVIKALGAASEQGAELDDLVALGERVNSVARTMGMALTSCTPPAKGSPLFDLGDDEMEMGVGIHGEPGRRREKLASANVILDELLEAVVTDLPFKAGDNVALMINGLGGTPISELYLLYGRAHEQLADRGINVTRNYVGEYCTSLDMAGCLGDAGAARRRAVLVPGRPRRDRRSAPSRASARRPRPHRGGVGRLELCRPTPPPPPPPASGAAPRRTRRRARCARTTSAPARPSRGTPWPPCGAARAAGGRCPASSREPVRR